MWPNPDPMHTRPAIPPSKRRLVQHTATAFQQGATLLAACGFERLTTAI